MLRLTNSSSCWKDSMNYKRRKGVSGKRRTPTDRPSAIFTACIIAALVIVLVSILRACTGLPERQVSVIELPPVEYPSPEKRKSTLWDETIDWEKYERH